MTVTEISFQEGSSGCNNTLTKLIDKKWRNKTQAVELKKGEAHTESKQKQIHS